jgi:hypothetical protein
MVRLLALLRFALSNERRKEDVHVRHRLFMPKSQKLTMLQPQHLRPTIGFQNKLNYSL